MPAARTLLILCLTAGLAASAGCKKKDEIPPEVDAALNKHEAPAPEPEQKTGIVGRKTIEVLDAPAVIAAGTHTIAQDKIGEGPPLGDGGAGYTDPISGPLNALGSVTGFAGQYPMQQWVNGEYALNGKYPTYEQFTGFLQKNKQYAMPMPRLSQRYGYDETRGAVVVLDVVGGIPDEGGSLDMDGDRLLPQKED
ncbi:hypothetical protein [Alienimonas californiensis]|uniref:Lipoprotein n=1 Tax=Alienimonas californiensis TaxID=2527989 RepID=A0A517P9S1_9PLAN|nr:hypothetical protein [Alienimonas californiensis]QDT16112.1 hypothetical protein CA12_22100 [Alienimonas californiensis]